MIGSQAKTVRSNHSQWLTTKLCITILCCSNDLCAGSLLTRALLKIKKMSRNYWITAKLPHKIKRTIEYIYC
jgi:hypothetical protein